jgi:hypothetical protein
MTNSQILEQTERVRVAIRQLREERERLQQLLLAQSRAEQGEVLKLETTR